MISWCTISGFLVLWLLLCAWRVCKMTNLFSFDRLATVPLRGLLAMLVVLGHLSLRTDANFGFLQYFEWHVYAVAVFFFMSGYGYAKTWVARPDYLDGFVLRTVRKLLLPLVIVMSVYVVFAYTRGLIDWTRVWAEILDGQTPLCRHSWYVYALFALAVLFHFSAKFFQGRAVTVSVCILTLALYAILRCVIHWPSWWYASLVAFPIGFVFARVEACVRRIAVRPSTYVWVAVLILLVGLGGCVLDCEVWPFLMQALMGPAVALGFYVLPIPVSGRTLGWLGGISYEIYLVHGTVRNTIMRHVLWGMDNMFGLITVLMTILAAVALRFGMLQIGRLIVRKGH